MVVEKNRAQVVVIIEWFLFLVAVSTLAIVAGVWSQDILDAFKNPDLNCGTKILTIIAVISVGIIFSAFLSILLANGVLKEHPNACQIWYIVNIIFIVCYTVVFILELSSAIIVAMTGDLLPIVVVVFIKGGLLWYRICAVDIIMKYTKELQSSRNDGHICCNQDNNGNDAPPSHSVAVSMKV